MAVFEYRGLVAATGKQVTGVRDADNAKVLRALLKREGVLITAAHEEAAARNASKRVKIEPMDLLPDRCGKLFCQ